MYESVQRGSNKGRSCASVPWRAADLGKVVGSFTEGGCVTAEGLVNTPVL